MVTRSSRRRRPTFGPRGQLAQPSPPKRRGRTRSGCAYYVEMIAKHGLVAIHTPSSSPLVAPPGGIRPVLGTNPIAIAVPSSRGPIVLDMGTSAYMMTEVMLRERLGE